MELRETRVRPREVDRVAVNFVRVSILRTQTSRTLLLGGGRFEYFLLEELLHGSRQRATSHEVCIKGEPEKRKVRAAAHGPRRARLRPLEVVWAREDEATTATSGHRAGNQARRMLTQCTEGLAK